ncbi:MAG TPA: NADH-quinone oxidoreductase subunit C, partial [Candidatus Dormibacteraeota bacterium]|nr:NADH-quinone oxidoreductase subunit C [Candidatus Dormibacteraeota bacterium]
KVGAAASSREGKMPSTQTPPIAGLATDPTSLRADLGDADVRRVSVAELRATMERLHAEGFTMLLDLGAADYPQRVPRFDIVYHLLAMPTAPGSVAQVGTPKRVRVLCGVEGEAPSCPSVMDIWPNADWAEREVFDLFGVTFSGHADLRRIQMPYEWEGHPLRKDYPLRGPARERAPRPTFALKSNVQAGTPPSGRTLEALQAQVKEVRERNAREDSK